MVLGNLALSTGIEPRAMTEWMGASFIDGADWVMAPNVIGMAPMTGAAWRPRCRARRGVHQQDERPLSRLPIQPRKRTGADACPYTSLYWDFLARHEQHLKGNHRMSTQLGGMRRLADLEETRDRAREVTKLLQEGRL